MQSGDSVNNNDEHEITGSLSWINGNVYATSYITLTKILRRRQQIN